MLRALAASAGSSARAFTGLAPRAVQSHRLAPVRSMASAAAAASPKAAMMIIGDEILRGSIADTNTPWIAKLLYSRGVDVVRVEMVPDDKEDIIATVHRLRDRVGPDGFVFTSGGIGPTHDDITYESLAEAFGTRLELHAPTKARMHGFYDPRGVELNAARLRMATLPVGAEVLYTEGTWVPLVNLEGVYVLPGIPRLFKSMVDAHKERFQGASMLTDTIYTRLGEGDVADPLGEVAKNHPQVHIGSYPNSAGTTETRDSLPYNVKLSFESRDEAALEAAVKAAEEAMPTYRIEE